MGQDILRRTIVNMKEAKAAGDAYSAVRHVELSIADVEAASKDTYQLRVPAADGSGKPPPGIRLPKEEVLYLLKRRLRSARKHLRGL